MYFTTMAFKCDMCPMTFSDIAVQSSHMLLHPINIPTCTICLKSFSTTPKLNRHVLRHAANRPTFECVFCHKHLLTKESMQRHTSRHLGENPIRPPQPGPFMCEWCPLKFPSLTRLQIHQEVHDIFRPYGCPNCYYRFLHASQIPSHRCLKTVNV